MKDHGAASKILWKDFRGNCLRRAGLKKRQCQTNLEFPYNPAIPGQKSRFFAPQTASNALAEAAFRLFGADRFDKAAVTEQLKQQGITPVETHGPRGFYVLDPDGYPIQIVATENQI